MGNNYSVPDLPIDFGTEIERFQCKYVGSVPVGAPKGEDVTNRCKSGSVF